MPEPFKVPHARLGAHSSCSSFSVCKICRIKNLTHTGTLSETSSGGRNRETSASSNLKCNCEHFGRMYRRVVYLKYDWAGPGSACRERWVCLRAFQPECIPQTRYRWTWCNPGGKTNRSNKIKSLRLDRKQYKWILVTPHITFLKWQKKKTGIVSVKVSCLWVEHDLRGTVPARGHVLCEEPSVIMVRVGYTREPKITDLETQGELISIL